MLTRGTCKYNVSTTWPVVSLDVSSRDREQGRVIKAYDVPWFGLAGAGGRYVHNADGAHAMNTLLGGTRLDTVNAKTPSHYLQDCSYFRNRPFLNASSV
jgi:hypothetical protein